MCCSMMETDWPPAARDMVSNVVIGDMSLLTDYTYKTDIDEQTYNHVKLAGPTRRPAGQMCS